MLDELPPGTDVLVRHVYGGHLSQKQQLGQLLGVGPVVLTLAAKDQSQLTRMGHDDPLGNTAELLIEVAVAAGSFEANRQPASQLRQPPEQLFPRAPMTQLLNLLAVAIKNAHRNVSQMNVQANKIIHTSL